jgi:hypothetical protein
LERFKEGAKETLSAKAESSDLNSVGKLLAAGSLAAAITAPGEGPLLARLPPPKEPSAVCAAGRPGKVVIRHPADLGSVVQDSWNWPCVVRPSVQVAPLR